MKYVDAKVVFQEIPDEITLAISISGCTIHCAGCHSKYLWNDIGELLTIDSLKQLIEKNSGITCVCFMGGDSNPFIIADLAHYIKDKYSQLKVAWYSGNEFLVENFDKELKYFDYIKLGPYDMDKGPIDKNTTNQRMYEYNPIYSDFTIGKCWRDITNKFWKTKQ